MEKNARTVISKSAKRKMSSEQNKKADTFTEMVVYRVRKNGAMRSVTKHEPVARKF